MKTKWEIVEHNWSDTSIYDQDGRLVCTRCIEDECTEENQDELEDQVSKDFGLIVLAPEMKDHLENLVDDIGYLLSELEDRGFEWQQAGYYTSAKQLIKEINERV